MEARIYMGNNRNIRYLYYTSSHEYADVIKFCQIRLNYICLKTHIQLTKFLIGHF